MGGSEKSQHTQDDFGSRGGGGEGKKSQALRKTSGLFSDGAWIGASLNLVPQYDGFFDSGALRYFSRAISKYISSVPFESRTPVR